MLKAVAAIWSELIDAIADVVQATARLRRPSAVPLVLGDDGVIRSGAGETLEECGRELAGAACRLSIPANWCFQTALNPISLESRPFLEAFARQQIERVTPWRESDVFVDVAHEPSSNDQNRLVPVLTVVPKNLVSPFASTLEALGCRSLSIWSSVKGRVCEIEIGKESAPASSFRWKVAIALTLLFAGLPLAGGLCWWRATLAQNEAYELALHVTKLRNTIVQSNLQSVDADTVRGAERPRVVVLLEELSDALPDSSYLTHLTIDGDRVDISGVASDPPALVPILERSGRFSDVAFSDAITRSAAGSNSRFSLEMHIVDEEAVSQ
jgi:general secretion pathway protein L